MAGTMGRVSVLDGSKEVEGAVSGCGRLAYVKSHWANQLRDNEGRTSD